MKKIVSCVSIISAFLFINLTYQIAFAEENNIISVKINIDSVTQEISFGLDKTGEFKIPADPLRKAISISLSPGSQDHILLPWCSNKVVDVNHSASCPVYFTDAITLKFIEVDAKADEGRIPTSVKVDLGLILGAIIGMYSYFIRI